MGLERRLEAEAQFASLTEQLVSEGDTSLAPLSAGLLAASFSGYCSDSHTFSKRLGIEHALVIRECVQLADELGMIEIDHKNERSQRLRYKLTNAGLSVFEGRS
ncbi:MAG: hypothetical protein AAGG69_04290 [Pseudomonadota bacterium]